MEDNRLRSNDRLTDGNGIHTQIKIMDELRQANHRPNAHIWIWQARPEVICCPYHTKQAFRANYALICIALQKVLSSRQFKLTRGPRNHSTPAIIHLQNNTTPGNRSLCRYMHTSYIQQTYSLIITQIHAYRRTDKINALHINSHKKAVSFILFRHNHFHFEVSLRNVSSLPMVRKSKLPKPW